ncbi:MAG: hypothetical protein PVG22_16920 [Chromatiales bacterium]
MQKIIDDSEQAYYILSWDKYSHRHLSSRHAECKADTPFRQQR